MKSPPMMGDAPEEAWMRVDRKIVGNIDQTTAFFDEPVPKDPTTELWIDLEKVILINSIGVMQWMRWFKSFPTTGRIFFVNAPLHVVIQASLVDDFFPKNSRVESFRSLYFCDNCSEEKTVLFQKNRDYFYADDIGKADPEIRMPQVHCPKCAGPMEPDFSGTRAFAFLKR